MIKRMSDGTLVIKKAGKWLNKWDKLTGIDNVMRKGKDFTWLQARKEAWNQPSKIQSKELVGIEKFKNRSILGN